jgi:hypothetical protein
MSSASEVMTFTLIPTEIIDLVKRLDNKIESLEKIVNGHTDWLTPKEAAAYTKKSKSHLLKIKDEIGFSQSDRLIIFRRQALDEWLMKDYHAPKK